MTLRTYGTPALCISYVTFAFQAHIQGRGGRPLWEDHVSWDSRTMWRQPYKVGPPLRGHWGKWAVGIHLHSLQLLAQPRELCMNSFVGKSRSWKSALVLLAAKLILENCLWSLDTILPLETTRMLRPSNLGALALALTTVNRTQCALERQQLPLKQNNLQPRWAPNFMGPPFTIAKSWLITSMNWSKVYVLITIVTAGF